MITPTSTLKQQLPSRISILSSSSSVYHPSPQLQQQGPSPSPISTPRLLHLPTTSKATATPAAVSFEEEKKERARQYYKAHCKRLKQNGTFEEHKEKIRKYNAKRRKALNAMAKEYGISVRKMEQTLKETKKNTGVDLLSIATKDHQNKQVSKEGVDEAPSIARTPQQAVVDVNNNNNAQTAHKVIPAAQKYLAQRWSQSQQPSLPLPSPPAQSFSKKEVQTKVTAAANSSTVITPSSVSRPAPPPKNSNKAAPTTATNTNDNNNSENQKKNKHNQHNRAYRDKLKKDKRRYEEHKEKARQYNEKRRKKLRAMAKETGLTMKEMERTISEAKIISALTVTASKEAEKFRPVVVPSPPEYHVISVSPVTTNCLDILSDAASIVLSRSSHQEHQATTTVTPPSPRRQHRAVSEDNCDSFMEVNSN